MFNFEGQICDICGNAFDKNSDIVVCPECGTPHHRECWHRIGHCVNESKHSEGFEWQPVRNTQQPAEGSITCPGCGSIMPQGTQFCENCGRSLKQADSNTTVYKVPGGTMEVHQFPSFGTMSHEEYKARVDRELAGEIDGVPLREIAVFIGQNAQYYIYRFKRMQQNPKYRPFNLTAFFFPPLWFLFRKMWKTALLAGCVNMFLNIPTLIMVAAQAGAIPATSPLLFPGIETVAKIGSILILVVGAVWGYLAIPMYQKDTVRRLKKLKEEANGDMEKYYRSILENAGPSKIGAIVVMIFALLYIFSAFTY
ncbi:MAG: DUF2628 domain-containing protein [Oscillospiraceae bacterium]|nr:DUF2628 domain-containing protein [Oscillospiraceae bacterium]